MLAPETLVRHELAGLRVRVVDAAHEGYVGIEGTVVDETTNTLLIGTDGDSGVMQVQKAGTSFEFALPGDDDGEWARASDGSGYEPVDDESAIERLRERYAAGDLSDEEFERRLARLVETEDLLDGSQSRATDESEATFERN